MWRIWLLAAAQFLGSLVGAILLVSLLPVIAHPPDGLWPFVTELAERFLKIGSGDFGRSAAGSPAMTSAWAAFPLTVQLLGLGVALALLMGISLGFLLSAPRAIRAAAPLLQIVTSVPVFLVGLALIWVATPSFHVITSADEPDLALSIMVRHGDWNSAWSAYFLPALTIGVAGAAHLQMSLRRAAAAAWMAPYRSGLRMMGLGLLDINLRFALPEIIAALLRDARGFILTLISATAIAEWIFHRNGAAVLFLNATASHDWAMATATLLLFAVFTLIVGFVGDLLASFIVPEDTL